VPTSASRARQTSPETPNGPCRPAAVQNLVGRRGCFRGAAGSWDCGWKPRFAPGHARGDSPQAQQHHARSTCARVCTLLLLGVGRAQAQGASRARHQLWPNSTGRGVSASHRKVVPEHAEIIDFFIILVYLIQIFITVLI